MTKDLGVWTADDCALVLIDYQNEMFEVIRSETSAELVELHVRLLAKTAKAFDMPIVLSTVGVGYIKLVVRSRTLIAATPPLNHETMTQSEWGTRTKSSGRRWPHTKRMSLSGLQDAFAAGWMACCAGDHWASAQLASIKIGAQKRLDERLVANSAALSIRVDIKSRPSRRQVACDSKYAATTQNELILDPNQALREHQAPGLFQHLCFTVKEVSNANRSDEVDLQTHGR